MRGTFNPWLRVAETAAALAGVTWLTAWVYQLGLKDPTAPWARVDARLAPVAFLLGLLVGHLVGRKRLALLRRVWPELDGRFFFTESAALDKYGGAAGFVQLQLSLYAWAIVAAAVLVTYTAGGIEPWASAPAFLVGCLLAGRTVPLVRLWAERRRGALRFEGEPAGGSLTERGAVRWLGADVALRLVLALAIAGAAIGVAGAGLGHWTWAGGGLGAVGLLAGTLVGYPIGAKRLTLLQRQWPELPRLLLLHERGALARSPEGRSVARLDKLAVIIPIVLWAGLIFVRHSSGILDTFVAWYLVAWYVASLAVPPLRLWLKVRGQGPRSFPSA
jgi:hypothetical protein